MRSLLLWALLLLALSVLCCYEVRAQNSTPILPGSEPLWSSLNEIALTLPSRYDNFVASLTGQVSSLQDNNQSLQASNDSLMQQNEDLRTSLAKSQAVAVTSAETSARLQADLDASMRSTIRAQNEARALQAQNQLMKRAGLVLLLAGGGYFVGHAAGVW